MSQQASPEQFSAFPAAMLQDLARDEVSDTANEIQDLADEADLPIEELLMRYGYMGGANSGSLDEREGGPPAPSVPLTPGEEEPLSPSEQPGIAAVAAEESKETGADELLQEDPESAGKALH